MIWAIVVFAVLGSVLGLLLSLAGKLLLVEDANPLIAEIEELLPGSQCGQCGFPGCSAAAEALAEGEAALTICPPGGRTLVDSLARLLDIDPSSIGEVANVKVASIKAANCTGCTKCFRACPTDAVVGASGQIHVVLEAACTGCKKCVEACPEDCVAMLEPVPGVDDWHWPKPALA